MRLRIVMIASARSTNASITISRRSWRGIVPGRSGQDPVWRDAVPAGHAGALHALLALVDGLRPAHWPPGLW
jgi:hypothetical protein